MSDLMTPSSSDVRAPVMFRWLAGIYGVVCYAVFFVTFLYAVGFVGNFVVPKSIDSGVVEATGTALTIDVFLLGLFAVQHSTMARPGFKKWWTQFVPKPIERSTYVLATSIALAVLYWQWRPLPAVIWQVSQPVLAALIWAIFALGWVVVLISTFLIDHFDLFGLRQSLLFAFGRQYSHPQFRVRSLYRLVRHPIMLGFLIAFWATPLMTVGHLVFSVATTGYIVVGVWLEEADLVKSIASYQDYREQVRGFIPWPRRRGV